MPIKVTILGVEVELTDALLIKMAESFYKTKRAERGFALCFSERKRQFLPGAEHTGGRYSITTRNCTEVPETYLAGYYHTHAVGTSKPSWLDFYDVAVGRKMIDCRGGTLDGRIRCDALRRVPKEVEIDTLAKRRRKRPIMGAEEDPTMKNLIETILDIPAEEIPKIVKPPPPPVPVVPKVREEQVEFATSKFVKYIDIDTGEVVRIERVY